jgi:hypothetical protein
MTIVTHAYRPKRAPRKRKAQAVAITGPAIVRRGVKAENDNRPEPEPKSRIVTGTDRKRLKLARAERRSQQAADVEVSPVVKAFFARMVRPGGALPPGVKE